MTRRLRKVLALEKKAYKLQRELTKILDEIYEVDEIFGDTVLEAIQDEEFIRSK